MRAIGIVAVGILMSAGLAGCDMPGSAPQQQQAAVTAPVPPCNCQQDHGEQLARLHYAPVRHRHLHRHGYRYASVQYRAPRVHGSYSVDRSQESVDAYDYRSTSTVSSSSSMSMSSETSGYYEGAEQSQYYAGDRRIVWVDGYGRGYYGGQHPTVSATMRGKRLTDPYHGYLVDCPDNGWH